MYEKVRFLPNGFKDERRVIIVDYQHLAYKYLYGAKGLSARVDVGGGLTKVVDTTIPNYTIKNIYRLSQYGMNPVVVCMDSPIASRKQAFHAEQNLDESTEKYKGSRSHRDKALFEGIKMTENILKNAGVTVLKKANYEADDLALAAVVQAKKQFPDLPIDVITGDWDYAPLVDDQVSVYLTSRKRTFADTGISRTKYVQCTPNTVEMLAGETSAYKGLYMPYNSLLLWKLLRGDKSDDISPMKNENGRNRWTPTKMRKYIEFLEQHNLLTNTLWGYSHTPTYVEDLVTHQKYDTQLAMQMVANKQLNIKQIKMQIEKPLNYTEMEQALEFSVNQGVIEDIDAHFILNRYPIMNLNGAFLKTETRRAPYVMNKEIGFIDPQALQACLDPLQIKLPVQR